MRLIDADELVKAFNEAQVEFDEYYKGLGRAKVITDNAPTVPPEYFPPCEDCNKKMEEIRQAYDNMKAMERPQGEWELSSIQVVGENWYKCSICGRKIRTSTYHLKEYPFCHCGADMRKGDAE